MVVKTSKDQQPTGLPVVDWAEGFGSCGGFVNVGICTWHPLYLMTHSDLDDSSLKPCIHAKSTERPSKPDKDEQLTQGRSPQSKQPNQTQTLSLNSSLPIGSKVVPFWVHIQNSIR